MKIIRLDKTGFREEETLKDLYYSLGWNFAIGYPYELWNEKSGIREKIEQALYMEVRKFGYALLRTEHATHYIL